MRKTFYMFLLLAIGSFSFIGCQPPAEESADPTEEKSGEHEGDEHGDHEGHDHGDHKDGEHAHDEAGSDTVTPDTDADDDSSTTAN
jgi:hypothetical protein